MAFYSYIFSANYKRYFYNLKKVSQREDKNFIKLILDTGYCVFRYGFALSDYLNYKLYNKNKYRKNGTFVCRSYKISVKYQKIF